MDRLDLGILRELSRDQIVWFGRLDPRTSAAEIARRLGVDRGTVSVRLRAWERSGFLRGHEAVPSPLLFGARIAGGNLRIDDLRAKVRVLHDLELVPGVISAVDHVGPWVALLYAFETGGYLDRSRRLLARLSGVDEVSPCVPFRAPEPTVVPTATDWRLLAALGADPRAPVGRLAERVRVSSKTLVRRLEGLVRGRAVWYLPLLDFTRYQRATVARFLVALDPAADPGSVGRTLSRSLGGISHLVDASTLVPDGAGPRLLDLGVHLDSVAVTEDVQRSIRETSGVVEVEVLFPRRFYLYRGWFDEQMARRERRGPSTAPAPGARPS